jgi:hypothetical protein
MSFQKIIRITSPWQHDCRVFLFDNFRNYYNIQLDFTEAYVRTKANRSAKVVDTGPTSPPRYSKDWIPRFNGKGLYSLTDNTPVRRRLKPLDDWEEIGSWGNVVRSYEE